MIKFNAIFLNRAEYRLLKSFKKHPKIDISNYQQNGIVLNSELSTLLEMGFVKENSTYNKTTRMNDYDSTASITKSGLDYLEFSLREAQNRLIPYIITTAISVIALIKSFMPEIVLLLKLLTRLPQ